MFFTIDKYFVYQWLDTLLHRWPYHLTWRIWWCYCRSNHGKWRKWKLRWYALVISSVLGKVLCCVLVIWDQIWGRFCRIYNFQAKTVQTNNVIPQTIHTLLSCLRCSYSDFKFFDFSFWYASRCFHLEILIIKNWRQKINRKLCSI